MNLEYKILWLDDQPHSQKGLEDNLRMRLAREGFDLKVKWVEEIKGEATASIRGLVAEDEWDLVMVDWDQGKDKLDGAQLAKRVRNEAKYTEIVFYSSESPGKLRELVFKEGVDGVYCAQRGDPLKVKAWGVIITSIRKVLDLNHMRGVVMAAVADLDSDVDECLRKLHSNMLPERREKLVADIIARIQEVANDNVKQMAKLVDVEFDKVLSHRAFSTNLKSSILRGAIKEFSEELAAGLIMEKFSLYDQQVVGPRNMMAHQKVTKEGKTLRLGTSGEVITEEVMSGIRRKLHEHRENLGDLGGLLDQWGQRRLADRILDAQEAPVPSTEPA